MKQQTTIIHAYIVGFLLSIIFTLCAYLIVALQTHFIHNSMVLMLYMTGIFLFAFLQLLVQLFFFLHLGKGSHSRWNITFLVSTFFSILVIVIGSMWIMYHLNYNMTPTQMNQYINDQSGF